MPVSTTPSLIQGLKYQEPEVWGRFTRIYAPLVWEWCRIRNLQQSDAEDVVSDVFHAVLHSIGQFEMSSFRGWLRTITENKIRDCWKLQARRERATGGSSAQQMLQNLVACPSNEVAATILEDEAREKSVLYRHATKMVCAGFRNGELYWQIFEKYIGNE
ncbi:MAG: sigma-70 family RNA polymerase sigma factor [Planctomycetes bacterium]|nr:sigma-70 family RNA polymerase sigma factor [Planctomycetota bacterium]